MKKTLGISLIALMLTACNDKPAAPDALEQKTTAPVADVSDVTTVTATKNPNWETVIVATQADFPPFTFKDEKGGVVGFERDLLEAIAAASEFNIDVIDISRKNMQQNLDGNSVGIWVSAIAITPEREQVMDMSKPYLNLDRVVAILDDDANAGIKGIEDMVGKTLAYSTSGTKEADRATDITKDASITVPEKTSFLALKAVYSKKTIGALGVDRAFEYYASRYPDTKIRLVSLGNQAVDIGFAVKEGNTALKQKIDSGLEKVKADGTYDKLLAKWFGDAQN